jgi:hypothetical protein
MAIDRRQKVIGMNILNEHACPEQQYTHLALP